MLSSSVVKAINYIKLNLDEKITVDDIAEEVHFSKYHFNRMFKDDVGESIYSFIKRLRLEQSMLQLIVNSKKSITEVSSIYGYSSSNYNVAVKNHFDRGPKEYRDLYINTKIKKRDGHFADLSNKEYSYYMEHIELVNIESISVNFVRVKGDYRQLFEKWDTFESLYPNLFSEKTLRFEISYNDPLLTSSNECMTDLCVLSDKQINSCESQIIKGGKYAVYHFDGSYSNLFGIYQGLLGIWAPKSAFRLDLHNRKIFSMIKLYSYKDDYYEFDIFIPLK